VAAISKRTVTWTTKNGEQRTAEKWRARYIDPAGKRYARNFDRKRDAQIWLDEQTTKLVTGTHIAPHLARTTVEEWCDVWLAGYATRRDSTVRQAKTHVKRIKEYFGRYALADVRPSHVRSWCAAMKAEGLADSTIYALHTRLAQIYTDAVIDGLVVRSPCSRRTAPPAGRQRVYVATTEQVWALYDAMPANLKVTILLGAFLGMRDSEACAARVGDLDLMRGVWNPAMQFPDVELKTACSTTPVAFPPALALEMSAWLAESAPYRKDLPWIVVNQWGDQLAPWTLQRAIRAARGKVPGLPDDFRFHDLRHYFASMLIADGADVKKVQAALRHASAKTTLDTYSHLWPDSDESIRAAGEKVFRERLAAKDKSSKKG
jgi:integrase